MYTAEYTGEQERGRLIAEAEVNNQVMIHDDYDASWKRGEEPRGTLTFDAQPPPSAEEIAERQEIAAMERADELIDTINNLSSAKTFLKRLCRRLIQKGVLP